MREAEFWSTRLRPQLIRECQEHGWKHHFERVENTVATGTPDVDYCITGVCGKIELKYTAAPPLHDTSQVLGPMHGMRRSQVIWAARRAHAGGRIYLLIGTAARDLWLIDLRQLNAPVMATLGSASANDLQARSVWSHRTATGPLAGALIM